MGASNPIVYCVECLGRQRPWHRIFEDSIMIGWWCSHCYGRELSRKRLLAKSIRMGVKALGRFEKIYKKRRYYSTSKLGRRNVKYLCLSHYSNNSMKCAECESMSDLCIDHINHDGFEEREEIGITGGYFFYMYLFNKKFPEGYRVLCRSCNSKDYNKNMYKIIPKRYINKFKENPKILVEYRAYLLGLFKDI